MKRQFAGFMLFIREQGVIGLAVGLVLGSAIKSLVDSLVDNIINPTLGLMLGGADLSNKFWCLHSEDVSGVEVCTNKLGYGAVVSSIISFVVIAAIVYFVVMGLKLDKLDMTKEEGDEIMKKYSPPKKQNK